MTKKLRHRWRPKTQRDWLVLTVCAIPIVFAALILTLSFTLPMVQLGFFRAVSIVMIMATLLLYHALTTSAILPADDR